MKRFTGGSNGLPESERIGLDQGRERYLIRVIFLCTVLVLPLFAVLQFLDGHAYLAAVELAISAVALCGIYRIGRTPNVRLWIVSYLILAFGFFVFLTVKPGASPTTFVWLYLMPVVSYLLLGRLLGFAIAAPFMLYVVVDACLQLTPQASARDWINLLNPIICGAMMVLFVHLYATSRAAYQARLSTLARTDALTGLANRSSFQSSLDYTIADAQRRRSRFALVLFDIDHFKRVNDSFGHDAGDHVLQRLSRLLSDQLRSTDAIGRLGGEEFGLILRDANVANTRRITEHLRASIADQTINYDKQIVQITATFGIAHWPTDAQSARDLYREADRRLYAGKHAGRNVVIDDSPPADSATQTLATELGEAL